MNTNPQSAVLSSPKLNLSRIVMHSYPWIIISFCAFFLMYKYVLQVSPSVMTNDLMREFHINGAGLGNLAATYFYAYLVVQVIAGPLLDRFSPRYLTSFAIGLCALGAFVFAMTHSLAGALLARALMGAGTAFATVSYMKMSAMWFLPSRVAMVDGFLATAAMIGALAGQVPLTILVNHSGWRMSLLYCGVFGLILMISFLFLVKDKKTSQSLTANLIAPISIRDILGVLKSKKNWLLTFYSGLAFTPIAVLGGLWGNPFFEISHHLTATEAATFTSFIFLGLAVGGPLFGFFADYVRDRLDVMIGGTVLALLTLMIALYVTALPLIALGVILFLFGLGTGVFMLSYPLGKSLNPIGMAATIVAFINTGDALLGSFTEPLIGKILDFLWQGKLVNGVHYFSIANFHMALAFLPLYLILSLVCLIILKRLR